MDQNERAKLEALVRARAQEGQERWRRRLVEIVKKKFRTAFIGALAVLEEGEFGALWGHGKQQHRSERTPEELAWLEVWKQTRALILDNGNAQMRAVEKELGLHEVVKFNKPRVVMPIRKCPEGLLSQEEKEEVIDE